MPMSLRSPTIQHALLINGTTAMDARVPIITYTRKKHDKRHGRKSSYVEVYNTLLKQTSVYEPAQKLGRGTYGIAHEFKEINGNDGFAVKKPRASHALMENAEDRRLHQLKTRNEILCTQRAYPGDGPYELFEFDEDLNTADPILYDYRMILPFREGQNLHDACLLKPHPDLLFYAFYRILKEAHRLHTRCHLVHGDLSPGNIIVSSKLSVKFVDFYFAYSVGANASIFILDDDIKTYIAPERINASEPVIGDATQDVYTLAHTFKTAYQLALPFKAQIEFLRKYPCIDKFITEGLSLDPTQRPSIADTLKAMKADVFIPKLLAYAQACKKTEVRYMLHPDNFELKRHEIYECILSLFKHKYLYEAERMIYLLQKMEMAPRDKAMLDLLYYILHVTQHMNKLHCNLYHQSHKTQLMESMMVSLKLAKLALPACHEPIPESLAAKIGKQPGLSDIYQALILTDCITLKKIGMDNIL